MIKNKLSLIALIFALFIVFRPWLFFDKTLSSGDWPYLYPENIREFQIPIQPPFYWLEPYYQITAKIGVQLLGLSWNATEKIFWFIPLIILGIFSSWIFLKYIFREFKLSLSCAAIGSFIFIANTYFLMLVGGGQMGVSVAYSFAPLVLYFLIKILKEKISLRFLLLSSLVLAIQLMFDPRIFLITLFAFFIYILFFVYLEKNLQAKNIIAILCVIFVSLFLNLFWIISNVSFYKQEYTLFATEPLASFLSFATFSNAISLLHPNWPENIFGKISFMKPEFIILGIIPYLSLLFIDLKNKKDLKDKKQSLIILSFAFLGLLGSFLSKGVNPPFGEIYEFISTIPGSSLFRDPTKFYILTSLSYSVLIPLSLYFILNFLNKRLKNLGTIFVVIFFVYLLVLIRPAMLGQLGGTFSPHDVPKEYISFKNFIIAQKSEFNTLWVPSLQRFGFSSIENRAISESELFLVKDVPSASAILNNEEVKKDLEESNVKYIVVPYDSLEEIFLEDRKYNDDLYKKTISDLDKFKWLSKLLNEKGDNKFGKIVVYEVVY